MVMSGETAHSTYELNEIDSMPEDEHFHLYSNNYVKKRYLGGNVMSYVSLMRYETSPNPRSPCLDSSLALFRMRSRLHLYFASDEGLSGYWCLWRAFKVVLRVQTLPSERIRVDGWIDIALG